MIGGVIMIKKTLLMNINRFRQFEGSQQAW